MEESIAFAKIFDGRFLMNLYALGDDLFMILLFLKKCLPICVHDKNFVASINRKLEFREALILTCAFTKLVSVNFLGNSATGGPGGGGCSFQNF